MSPSQKTGLRTTKLREPSPVNGGLSITRMVVYRFQPRDGFKYVLSIPATVIREKNGEVLIEFKDGQGATMERWVKPEELLPNATFCNGQIQPPEIPEALGRLFRKRPKSLRDQEATRREWRGYCDNSEQAAICLFVSGSPNLTPQQDLRAREALSRKLQNDFRCEPALRQVVNGKVISASNEFLTIAFDTGGEPEVSDFNRGELKGGDSVFKGQKVRAHSQLEIIEPKPPLSNAQAKEWTRKFEAEFPAAKEFEQKAKRGTPIE
jgi:hypothetical protein